MNIILYSEPTILFFKLVKHLLEKGLQIYIVTADAEDWKKGMGDPVGVTYFKDINDPQNFAETYYLVCDMRSQTDPAQLAGDYNRIYNRTKKISINNNLKALYIYNYRVDEKHYLEVERMVNEIVSEGSFFAGGIFLGDIADKKTKTKKIVFPVDTEEAAGFIIRSVFSLAAYKTTTAFTGKLQSNANTDRETKIFPVQQIIQARIIPQSAKQEKTMVESPIITKNDIDTTEKTANKKIDGLPKRRSAKRRMVAKIFIGIVILFFLPYFILALNLFTLRTAKSELLKNRYDRSGQIFRSINLTAGINQKYFYLLTKIPILEQLNRTLLDIALITKDTSGAGIKAASVAATSVNFFKNITTDSYDLNYFSKTTSLDLMRLYELLGFMKSEYVSASSWTQKLFGDEILGFDLGRLQEITYPLSKLADSSPDILGIQRPTKYAVVLQDDQYARPTGGKIVAYAIITFSGGKLVDWKVYEVNESDSKLIGFVDTPRPLEKYFGINGWSLGESNWENDFKQSAERFQWFLDKEEDITVDGVISVNLSTLAGINKNSISIGGTESESDYPKYLGSFLGNVFGSDSNISIDSMLTVLKAAETKDVMIYFNDQTIQENIKDAGWSGSIPENTCTNNCYLDSIAISEFSKEDSSGNMTRETDINIQLEEGVIKRDVRYYIENDNPSEYNAFIRFYIPADSGLGQMTLFSQKGKQIVTPDIYGLMNNKIAGTFISLKAGETAAIFVNWEGRSSLDYSKEGEYVLKVIKQSGIRNLATIVEIKPPKKIEPKSEPLMNLTGDSGLKYNSLTSQDLNLRLFW